MSGFQSSLLLADLKGCINIWVRCKKQRFGVGASTLLWGGGFQSPRFRGCTLTETKSLQMLSPPGRQHFQMCHSVDTNELVPLSWRRKCGDNLPVFAAAPVEASAAGWKITGNCWSRWIQFGSGWKTKKNKALIAETTRAGSSEALLLRVNLIHISSLEMWGTGKKWPKKEKKRKRGSERESETPALPANTIHLPYYI